MARSKVGGYTAVYERHGKWFIGYVREVPGAHTQGRTLTEVKANLRDALRMVLTVRAQLKRVVPRPKVAFKEEILIPAR